MYNIEKNIPLPSTALKTSHTFPLADMEINDSFLAPKMKRSAIQAAIKKYQDANEGTRFTTRMNKDETEIRTWRVA